MYDTRDLLPVEDVSAGTTLLCTGPPMTGKRDLALRLLGQGLDDGDGAIAVSTDATAGEIQESLQESARAEDATYRVGVVDASGVESAVEDVPGRVERIGSPTDLTGIGHGYSRLAERLVDVEQPSGLRVGVVSLSTLALYADPEAVMQFLHTLTRGVGERDGFAIVVLHDDAVEEETAAGLRSLVDGEIRVRERDNERELRVEGLTEEPTEWYAMPSLEPPAAVAPAKPSVDRTADEPTAESLSSLLASVEADRPTLTICNFDGPAETLATVSEYFDRLNVSVRTAGIDRATPSNVALLHRGEDFLAGDSIQDIAAAIDPEGDDPTIREDVETPALLDHLDQTVFGAHGAGTDLLAQVSHTIETMAWRTGQGRLHAGFQELSRLYESEGTQRIYDRISSTEVDVHVYGVPDTEIPDDRFTVHAAESGELADTWFVGFTDPDEARTGVLLAEQREPGEYDGFWSYRPDLARRLDAYLERTYLGP